MSVADEILRLQQAKSDLATSIAAKGVTVPASATLDDYPALVDNIQQGGGLPYDAEIEYLQFAGTQYINLGFCQDTRNIEIRIRMQWTGDTINQFESFFGYMSDSGTSPRSGLHKYQGKWMFGTNATMQTTNVDNNEHDFFISGNSSANKEYLYNENSQIGTATTASTGISGNTIPYFVGCRNRNGSVDNYANMKIMSLSIMLFGNTNHTVVRHEMNLVPVRKGQVGYLYDRISGTLFGNQGTGSFTLGPDVT
jgi:hypothetical protein